MARWEPDASGRLTEAALALFAERGYEGTSVADIAGRAGVTERTFFRYFADKREVLFDGGHHLEHAVVDAVSRSDDVDPFAMVVDALASTSELFDGRIDFVRRRAAVIASHGSLLERELLKMSALSSSVAQSLTARGVDESDAELAAEVGVAVFRVAFGRWIADDATATLATHVVAAASNVRWRAPGA